MAPTRRVRKKAADPADPADFERVLRAHVRSRAAQWLADPRLTSVGLTRPTTAAGRRGPWTVQFTVDSAAVPEGALAAARPVDVPPVIRIGDVDVPTEVVPRSFKPAYLPVALPAKDPRKVRAEVVSPGLSVGNLHTSAGTIGAFVRDRRSGELLLLSNWHVLHGPQAALGVTVVQPGRHDDNRVEANGIGVLLRSHLGPAGDCAVARISGRGVSSQAWELGVSVTAIGDPELGDAVVKSGRTTGVTRGRVTRIEVNTRLDYGGGVVAIVGGFEVGLDPQALPPDGEISRGGDSGAAWMAVDRRGKPAPVMLGLHFAGDAERSEGEFALACYAQSVMTALDVEPAGELALPPVAQGGDDALRAGYDRDFLGRAIVPPTFTAARRRDLAVLEGDAELRYCHFSVWLSRQRKYALCVAWNIDGASFKRLKRTGFQVDRRGDLPAHQLTDAIYRMNPLDRGHIARRADLCWGPMEEARQANRDSFFYTNIVPQHEAFNQSGNTADDPEGGLWGRLENTLFDSENPRALKLTLMAGPVFGAQDRRFEQNGEQCLLPDEFWKVVAYVDEASGALRAYAFLLTQKHLLGPLAEGLDLAPWVWARIGLADLGERTGLRFPKVLLEHEQPFAAVESVLDGPRLRLIHSDDQFFSR
ncbi:MAG: DNA/RNA non-specific endonuclease [Aquincola tertiaricarbonis]